MADGLSQIAIEKLDKNNFQVWKFRIMNFLMGKGYWEFITGDEKEPPFPENPTQQQIQANKTWHEKAMKSCIGFLWVCPIPWLCIFKMQNHASKLGIHWWRCIAPIHKLAKCSSNKSCIIYRKTRWISMTILQRWKTLQMLLHL